MIRLLIFASALFCTATVGTIVMGVGYLWVQGTLTAEATADLRSILRGEDPTLNDTVSEEEDIKPSFQEIAELRASKILSLSDRESELLLVKQAIDQQVSNLVVSRKNIEKQRNKYQAELKKAKEQITSEAKEQARGILLKMNPELAAKNLLALELNEMIDLMKGMSEKDIAKILEKFPKDQIAIAEKIFTEIARGKPTILPTQNAEKKLDQSTLDNTPALSPNQNQKIPKTANTPIPPRA